MSLSLDEYIELQVLERVLEFKSPGNAPVRVLNKLVEQGLLEVPDEADGVWDLGSKANYYMGYLRARNGSRERSL